MKVFGVWCHYPSYDGGDSLYGLYASREVAESIRPKGVHPSDVSVEEHDVIGTDVEGDNFEI